MSKQPKLRKGRSWWRIPVALVILAVFLSPFYILLSVAFRSPQDLSSYWIFPSELHLENFQNAIEEGDILLSIFNSLVITVGAVFLVTVIGALAAYPLARRRTKLNMGIKGFALGIMMVPPLSIALCCTFFPSRFCPEERRSGLVNYIMGLCFITEGAIPFAASDPVRVIPACAAGSALAGGLAAFFRCTLPAPHGGIFVFPVIRHVSGYLIALAAGAVCGMLVLALLRKKRS